MPDVYAQLLDCAGSFANEYPPSDFMTGAAENDWQLLFDAAYAHKLVPVVFEAVSKLPSFKTAPSSLKASLRKTVISSVASQAVRSEAFLRLVSRIADENISAATLKGIVCRSLYANGDLRSSCDEDVFVSRDDFARCAELFSDLGMKNTGAADDEPDVMAFLDPKSGLKVELHSRLFSSTAPLLAPLNEYFEHALASAVETVVAGTRIRTFAPTENLIFLTAHAFKHFLSSGLGIRTVCDIFKLASVYGNEIDWNCVKERLSSVRAYCFFANLADIAVTHLGFDKSPPLCQCMNDVYVSSDALLSDILAAGVYGQSSLSRRHSTLVLRGALEESNGGRLSPFKALFPPLVSMKRRYPGLQKYPALLPYYWLKRIFRYLIELIAHNGHADNSALESLNIAKSRAELMRKYEIID